MAFDGPNIDWSFTAGGDLSTQQFRFVKLNTSGQVVAVAALTDIPVGILQNNPASGQEATVRVMGISKGSFDASIDEGVIVGTSADGQIDAKAVTDTTEYVLGQVILAATAAGQIGTLLVNCMNPTRAN